MPKNVKHYKVECWRVQVRELGEWRTLHDGIFSDFKKSKARLQEEYDRISELNGGRYIVEYEDFKCTRYCNTYSKFLRIIQYDFTWGNRTLHYRICKCEDDLTEKQYNHRVVR